MNIMKKNIKVKKKTNKIKLTIFILIISLIILNIGNIVFYEVYLKNILYNININLNSDTNITINLNEEFIEPGYNATYKKDDITNLVEVTNNVDNTKIGEYEIIYRVNYKNKYEEVKRIVKVVDDESPVIKLKGKKEETIWLNNKYKEDGYTVTDNYDKDLEEKVEVINNLDTSKEGTYEIIYKVSDSSGNTCEEKRKVIVKKRPLVHTDGVAVLNYHFFYNNNLSCGGSNCLHIDKFEEQLKYLTENNYKTLTMDEFVKYMYGEISIPSKAVLITIDDGAMGTGKHNGNLLIPMLEKYQVHATLFLITGWWNINNYDSPYLDVESHSHDMHTESYCQGVTRGAKMLCLSHDEVLNDLQTSMAITGSNKAYCYPFYAYNEDAVNIVKEAGFKLAFAGGSYKATRNSNKYKIPRFKITKNMSLEDFIYMVY